MNGFDLIEQCRDDRERLRRANEVRAHHGNPAIPETECERRLWAMARVLERALVERSALIGQRIVEDDHGRGWWAYGLAPEDAQGFPPPVLCPTYSEAEAFVLTANDEPAPAGSGVAHEPR